MHNVIKRRGVSKLTANGNGAFTGKERERERERERAVFIGHTKRRWGRRVAIDGFVRAVDCCVDVFEWCEWDRVSNKPATWHQQEEEEVSGRLGAPGVEKGEETVSQTAVGQQSRRPLTENDVNIA